MKIISLILLFLVPSLALAYDELCPTVRVKNLKKINLNENEKRLLCGDKEVPAWKEIPAYQALYFVTGFLQARGYLRPVINLENGILYVRHGPLAKIKKIRVEGETDAPSKKIQTKLRQLFNKKKLNTEALNSIEAEGLAQYRNRGYPCTDVKSEADIEKNIVYLRASRLWFHEFGEVIKEPIEGLHENALNRFYPFESNQPFNADLLKLTERRMTRSEVVQGTYFLEKCGPLEFELRQNFIIGPPRTLRYGVGASTELGPMARIRWSHNRLGTMASQLSATAQASLRSQSLNLSADTFLWGHEPRRSILSQVELIRERQLDYEQFVYRVRPLMKWTRDSEGFHKLYTFGPSYEGGTYHSADKSDTRSFGSGLIEGAFQWMSHLYELYDILPQEGQLFTFNFDMRHPSLGFAVPLLKMEAGAVHAERISNWGRGSLIGALRLNLGTTWLNTDELSINSLPPSVKFFGGGSDDIRGFFYRTLPRNNGSGALTKVALKSELRKTYLLIPSLEAFAFLDGGHFSESPWTLDKKLFYSPGVGLRWLSPIGLVQGYGARAFTTSPNEDLGYFFYAGIGGTF